MMSISSAAEESMSLASTNFRLVGNNPFVSLSQGELGVLELLATGATNAQIADVLGRSEGTIRNITARLTVKLGVVDRTQAALLGFRAGLGRHSGATIPVEVR
jgi:DNA-binding NarL/FixJ family response regulator